MTDDEIKIRAIIARVAKRDPASLTADQQLVADLGIDSIKAMELLDTTEKELQIEAPDDAFGRINTVADVVELVANCKKAGGET